MRLGDPTEPLCASRAQCSDESVAHISIEIITCKDLFIEKKGIDGLMGRSFERLVAHTNVPNPIILQDGQRRWYVNEFDLTVAKDMEADAGYKNRYLKKLFEAYADDNVWRAFAYQLFMMVPSLAAAHEEIVRFGVRRVFNPNTSKVQLESMVHFPERSVLGWLWKHLASDVPICGSGAAADSFVLEDDLLPDFTKWSSWTELRLRSDPRTDEFSNANWRENQGKDWWHKVEVKLVYTTYSTHITRMGGRPLDPMSFHAELRRILAFTSAEENIRPALRSASEVNRREVGYGDSRRTVAQSAEWLCFAPRAELREAISRALPASLHFEWSK
jgi:hypothetical protein